ncbi:polysaccharide biosynthesis protein [Alkaliphilus sp. B6464]|uniref:polysaccharide biosynthesis protein n=1 Tax=Alkaliphilus sp. B6464 TaxID=2731219 RepID=UPI001BA5E9A1|nr:polysaccharide biosynthesis protein [Alkaliphilus sp. B6464]QUH18595.1 polysaccharide biosynthesis protein [Alkaliphilus sp. B6464]
MFTNKTLLITGGTGSFGNAVLNRFLKSDVKEIRIFSRDEKKQTDMRLHYNNEKIKFIIGDVKSYKSIYYATKGVDYIFHAAALKQVPSCEFYPIEAVKTNILGADNVLNAAVENKVKKVIVLSTDKAVYPINAMGISKAMMEKLVIAKSRTIENDKTVLCCVRYGNVMASRGSVIPLFIEQINTGNALTITDPNMTRFLMTLDDAVNLVMLAFKDGSQGEIFVQKSPASTVKDLAIAIKEIFNSNLDIKVIGVRHGEKLHETLVTKEERIRSKEMEKNFVIRPDNRDLNYKVSLKNEKMLLSDYTDYNSYNTRRLNIDEIKELLLKLDVIRDIIEK